MDVNENFSCLASQFSTDVLNIVYTYRDLPLLADAYSNLFTSAGWFVVSLIKGELRNHFCSNARRVLERAITDDEVNDVLMQVPRSYVQEHPPEYMTILKAIAFTAMCSILYHQRNVRLAQAYAHNAITEMLLTLEDGRFVQRGGLGLLNSYADQLLHDQPELIRAFERGCYPW